MTSLKTKTHSLGFQERRLSNSIPTCSEPEKSPLAAQIRGFFIPFVSPSRNKNSCPSSAAATLVGARAKIVKAESDNRVAIAWDNKTKLTADRLLKAYEFLDNQAIYTHARQAHWAWRNFSAPFADTHLCSMGHGMANHLPPSILRFAQEPMSRPEAAPVVMTWKMLSE